jgi:hypothetical protein
VERGWSSHRTAFTIIGLILKSIPILPHIPISFYENHNIFGIKRPLKKKINVNFADEKMFQKEKDMRNIQLEQKWF